MGFKARRRNVSVGRTSKAMILPSLLEVGRESTMAGNRLVLSDPKGEIPEDALLSFYEGYVEPAFWMWYCNFKKLQRVQPSDAEGCPPPSENLTKEAG